MAEKSLEVRKAEAPEESESWSPLTSLQRRINRMFDQMWEGWPSMFGERAEPALRAFSPSVEVCESDDHVEVSAELPGLTEKDVSITLSPDGTMLTIRGEKKYEKEKKERDYYRAERSYGAFRRNISLPTKVESEEIEATMKGGVLEVKLPKAEASRGGPKQIEIKS